MVTIEKEKWHGLKNDPLFPGSFSDCITYMLHNDRHELRVFRNEDKTMRSLSIMIMGRSCSWKMFHGDGVLFDTANTFYNIDTNENMLCIALCYSVRDDYFSDCVRGTIVYDLESKSITNDVILHDRYGDLDLTPDECFSNIFQVDAEQYAIKNSYVNGQ